MTFTPFSLDTVFLEGKDCGFCPGTTVVSPVANSFS